MNTSFTPIIKFGQNSPYDTYTFTNGKWSQTNYSNDTWTASFQNISQIPSGEFHINISAQAEDGSQLDQDEDLSIYNPGNDTLHKFVISPAPIVKDLVINSNTQGTPTINLDYYTGIRFAIESQSQKVKIYITVDTTYTGDNNKLVFTTDMTLKNRGTVLSYGDTFTYSWNGRLMNGASPAGGDHTLYVKVVDDYASSASITKQFIIKLSTTTYSLKTCCRQKNAYLIVAFTIVRYFKNLPLPGQAETEEQVRNRIDDTVSHYSISNMLQFIKEEKM